MVEVIKHGEIKKKKIDCNSCGAVLRYEDSDIITRRLQNMFGLVIGEERYIVCPDCKGAILINNNKWG